MGAISNYYNFVNNQIENCDTVKEFFPKQEGFPSLEKLVAQTITAGNIDTSRDSSDLQESYLKLQRNFTDWTNAQTLCLPSISENYANTLLTEKLSISSENPERILLEYFFQEMYRNSSLQVQNQIINEKRMIQPLKLSFSLAIQVTVEKIINLVAKFLAHPTTRLTMFLTVLASTYVLGFVVFSAIQDIIISQSLAYLPSSLVETAAFIDRLILPILLIGIFTMSMAPNFHRKIFQPLEKILDWTFLLPITLAHKGAVIISILFHQKLTPLPTQLHALSSAWNSLRLGLEYREARNLWVNHFLTERAQTRADVEYDYAVQELTYMQENNLPTVEAQNKVDQRLAELNLAQIKVQ